MHFKTQFGMESALGIMLIPCLTLLHTLKNMITELTIEMHKAI